MRNEGRDVKGRANWSAVPSAKISPSAVCFVCSVAKAAFGRRRGCLALGERKAGLCYDVMPLRGPGMAAD